MTLSSKTLLRLCSVAMLFTACQKDLSVKESINGQAVSSDALAPLPCHSLSLITNYTTSRGQQPPFTFTKTLYPDSRVKTIKMLSRATPNHPQFKKQMWETIGTFAYSTNKATFTGTKELLEYYITSGGGSGKRSLGKKKIILSFNFNSRGYVETVWNELGSWDWNSGVYRPVNALHLTYGNQTDQNIPADAIAHIFIPEGSDEGIKGDVKSYLPSLDKYGNPLEILYDVNHRRIPGVRYTYDYTKPRGGKNYSFIPSQNLISFEYNMCEVMQWIPQPTHERKDVTGVFFLADGGGVYQKQYYKNFKFDAKGNQTSVTYADNILQKTSWFCK